MAKMSKRGKIIFISMARFRNIDEQHLYGDLCRYFIKKNFHLSIFSPIERRYNDSKLSIVNEDYCIYRYRIPNMTKAKFSEKALSTLFFDRLLQSSLKRNLKEDNYDLLIYCTPPISMITSILYLKKKYRIPTYLILKDIFPQNAVDLGFLRKESLIYKYFHKKEIKLYELSDTIGCMSNANVDYVLKNYNIPSRKVEVCPNSIDLKKWINIPNVEQFRKAEGIPHLAKVFIYGGNLGKPQFIKLLLQVIKKFKDNSDVFFIVIGTGTEYKFIKQELESANYSNVILKTFMSREKFNKFVRISDVGLIILDPKFTIPNYPSKLLDYLKQAKPILAITDKVTDVGKNAVKGGYGFSAASDDVEESYKKILQISKLTNTELIKMGSIGYKYLQKNYSTQKSFEVIVRSTKL